MREGAAVEIGNAIAAYCQAYDDHDRSGLEGVLHEDCVIVLRGGRFDGQRFAGRSTIVEWLAETWPVTPLCLHLTGNVRLEEDGAAVRGTTDYVFFVRREDRFEIAGRGRYLDRFCREADRWLLLERTVWQPT